jgi:anti-sigma factor RsiW
MTDTANSPSKIDRCTYQIDLGAFLLGGLNGADHLRVASHLVGCDRCNADIAEILPVLVLLESALESGMQRAEEEAPSAGLRQHVVAAVGRAGSEAVLASVRELRPGSSTQGSGLGLPIGSGLDSGLEERDLMPVSVGVSALVPEQASGLARPKRFDRRLVAAAAAVVLALGVTATTLRRSNTPGTSYQLVALQKDPLRASAKINTKNDTTVAEFVVNGTIPDEVYFAWFEDPDGKRIGLGSFRGAAGPVRFRGQTGVSRSSIVAVGASTRVGDKPTDRIRAELPKG